MAATSVEVCTSRTVVARSRSLLECSCSSHFSSLALARSSHCDPPAGPPPPRREAASWEDLPSGGDAPPAEAEQTARTEPEPQTRAEAAEPLAEQPAEAQAPRPEAEQTKRAAEPRAPDESPATDEPPLAKRDLPDESPATDEPPPRGALQRVLLHSVAVCT